MTDEEIEKRKQAKQAIADLLTFDKIASIKEVREGDFKDNYVRSCQIRALRKNISLSSLERTISDPNPYKMTG